MCCILLLSLLSLQFHNSFLYNQFQYHHKNYNIMTWLITESCIIEWSKNDNMIRLINKSIFCLGSSIWFMIYEKKLNGWYWNIPWIGIHIPQVPVLFQKVLTPQFLELWSRPPSVGLSGLAKSGKLLGCPGPRAGHSGTGGTPLDCYPATQLSWKIKTLENCQTTQ